MTDSHEVRPPRVLSIAAVLRALDPPDAPLFDDDTALDRWIAATNDLLGNPRLPGVDQRLRRAATLWAWHTVSAELFGCPREHRAEHIRRAGLATDLSARHLQRLADALTHPDELAAAVARRQLRAELLTRAEPAELARAIVEDTDSALVAIDAEPGTPLADAVERTLPWLAALRVTHDPAAAVEHESAPVRSAATPSSAVLEHVVRVLDRKLGGLEHRDVTRFQRDQALSHDAFVDECSRLERVRDAGLLPAVRAALLHDDLAKTGTAAQRARWQRALGTDLTVHNEAAAELLRRETPPGAARPGLLQAFGTLVEGDVAELTLALVRSHGLTGQALRGETPLGLFAPWITFVRRWADGDAGRLELAHDALHLVNVCDTAGVREGLLDDALRQGMLAVLDHLRRVALGDDDELDRALCADDRVMASAAPVLDPSDPRTERLGARRRHLTDRLARLRRGRLRDGEPLSQTIEAVDACSDAEIDGLLELLANGQLWYAEAATSQLSSSAQLKLLAVGLSTARHLDAVDTSRPFHVSLQPLLGHLHPALGGRSAAYRVRLLETVLDPLSLQQILDAPPGLDVPATDSPLGTFATRIGGTTAVALSWDEGQEATALLTLLPIYERKSSAGFHATLKTLCDLYGLRKDEFDRVANEAMYLVHMNSARSDKERMLDHVRPGRVVEVGPGGGVVLDLLEARYPDSEIIGIDVSHMVIEALHQKKQREGRRWAVIEADAFEMPALMGPDSVDTVIYCSLLHEIYSYVEHPSDDDPDGPRRRFRLESVRDLLRASYRTLRPGGRLVIRDGVMPEPGMRILELLANDALEFFELFVEQFEGRQIAFERLPGDGAPRVRLSTADAMEFLYCYTWGPESFPYEVREQYGVLPYLDYRDAVLDWLADAAHPPRWIELPAHERSYLQPGYETGLAGRVALYDREGHPVDLPDSNCLLVFEKT